HVEGDDLAADEAPRLRFGRLLLGRVAAVPVPKDDRSRSELRERSGVALHVGLERSLERLEAVPLLLLAVVRDLHLAVANDSVADAVADLEEVDRALAHTAARDGDLRNQGTRVLEQPGLEPVRLRGDRVDRAAIRGDAFFRSQLRRFAILVAGREPVNLVVALAPPGGRERRR